MVMMKRVIIRMITLVEKPVDIYNEFTFNNNTYKINPTLKQYEVSNFPILENGKYNNWTNNCEMDSVIIIENNEILRFIDQNGNDITNYVKQV